MKKRLKCTEHLFQQIRLTESVWRNSCPSPCFSAHHSAPTLKINTVGSHKSSIPERKHLEKSRIQQISKVQAYLSQCRCINQHHVENIQLLKLQIYIRGHVNFPTVTHIQAQISRHSKVYAMGNSGLAAGLHPLSQINCHPSRNKQ